LALFFLPARNFSIHLFTSFSEYFIRLLISSMVICRSTWICFDLCAKKCI